MIEIKNLNKKYSSQKVLDNLSFSVKKGITYGFLGPNGSGKTTTMKIIVGLTHADSGTTQIEGKPSNNVEMREKIGFMPENPYFYDHLTGLEFLKLCSRLFKNGLLKQEQFYDELLKRVGIFEARHKMVGNYSKGMRQRLAFAQTIVNDPDYIFLDEPLDGLDPIGRREIKSIIKTLKNSGKTIFFNSHILFDTEEICDEIGIINNGRLLYSGEIRGFCGNKSLEEQFVAKIAQTS